MFELDGADELPFKSGLREFDGLGEESNEKRGNGIERRVAHVDPIVVKDVMTNVATSG